MKRFILTIAVILTAICAVAQETRTELDNTQLLQDYVTLNNQMDKFRNIEIGAACVAMASAALSVSASYMSAREAADMMQQAANGQTPQASFGTSKALQIAAGVGTVAAAVMAITGVAQIKRDRLEVSPSGVVIKLGGSKREPGYFEPSLKEW